MLCLFMWLDLVHEETVHVADPLGRRGPLRELRRAGRADIDELRSAAAALVDLDPAEGVDAV